MQTNNSTSKYVVMLVGKTHSGKSTFARMLCDKYPSATIFETDPIRTWLNEYYPPEIDPDYEHSGEFKKVSLKYQLFLTLFDYGLVSKIPVLILANSNMHKKGRTDLREKIQAAGRTLITVYLDLSEKTLRERVATAGRSTEVLTTSHDFDELITKQRDRMVPPTKEEVGLLYHITDPNQIPDLIDELVVKFSHA